MQFTTPYVQKWCFISFNSGLIEAGKLKTGFIRVSRLRLEIKSQQQIEKMCVVTSPTKFESLSIFFGLDVLNS